MVVDDDEGICKIFHEMLVTKGCGVDTALTGHEALEKTDKKDFDVSIIDINLPDMDGISLMKKIKGIDPDIYCIMVTGHESSQCETEAVQAGAYSYLTKPSERDELLSTLKEAIVLQRPHTDLD